MDGDKSIMEGEGHKMSIIHFVDVNRRTLFKIPDGKHIIIHNYENGKIEGPYECRFIDPGHFQVNHRTYEISEFAEIMEKNKKVVFPDFLKDNIEPKTYDETLDGFSITVDNKKGVTVNGPDYEKLAEHILGTIRYYEQQGKLECYQITEDSQLVTRKRIEALKK